MGQRKTLGGDRVGSGKKMQVDTKTFNRSTHDLGYLWRSTMSAGTLVPFMVQVGLPGDTFDIELNLDAMTLPTVGPLFGGFKVQADVFAAPVRLYQGQLHNNKLGIGLKMQDVKLPQLSYAPPFYTAAQLQTMDLDNYQVNPSSILSYLGIRGWGIPYAEGLQRNKNATAFLAYWDIFKQYYANKQEEDAWMIHNVKEPATQNVDDITIAGTILAQQGDPPTPIIVGPGSEIAVSSTGFQSAESIAIRFEGQWIPLSSIGYIAGQTDANILIICYQDVQGTIDLWAYNLSPEYLKQTIDLFPFKLVEIDTMREIILEEARNPNALNIVQIGKTNDLKPYYLPFEKENDVPSMTQSQEGLAVKTYQSDLFNNWLDTEYIDGPSGISAVTAVSIVNDEFTIDSFLIQKKVYDMLNDIMVSGGTYDDWNEVVYDHTGITRAETPIYYGSLIKELQFQEVVSNTETLVQGQVQPLGTLAGRGRLNSKHKGGRIRIKCDEICVIMGIVSLTPRIDYSQGNEWHTDLQTMDDFHKPHLDQIGFQELITEQMAHWSTGIAAASGPVQRSAGKQPAWINYMTDVNKVKGNFAIPNNSDYMVLLRRYQPEITDVAGVPVVQIKDLTTYIDPRHFNHIFAQTSLDAQNFWVQIAVDIEARRKLSARVMPNL